MAKSYLPAMTREEIEQAFSTKPVVLFPLGSVEQHGPHTPVGDYRMAEVLAKEVAEIVDNTLVLPVLPFGYSEYFHTFPGCLTLRPSTLYSVVRDVCECVLDYGIDHLLFINGHRGNEPTLEQLGRDLRKERGIIPASILPWDLAMAEKKKLYPDNAKTGHGSDPMGSLNAYFFPEDMRMDLAQEHQPPTREYGDFKPVSPTKIDLNGTLLTFYLNFDEVTKNGVMGDPGLCSAERGQKMHDIMVTKLVDLVQAFAKLDTRAER